MAAENDSQEQADQAFPMLGAPSIVLVALPIYAITAAIAMVADNYVDPLWIWGGSDCGSAVNGVRSCVGYAPTGLILIGLVVGMVVLPAVGVLMQRRGD